jgi:hypothetical protein
LILAISRQAQWGKKGKGWEEGGREAFKKKRKVLMLPSAMVVAAALSQGRD